MKRYSLTFFTFISHLYFICSFLVCCFSLLHHHHWNRSRYRWICLVGNCEHSSHWHFIFINPFPRTIWLIIISVSLQMTDVLNKGFDIMVTEYNETENSRILDTLQQDVSKPKPLTFWMCYLSKQDLWSCSNFHFHVHMIVSQEFLPFCLLSAICWR